MLVLGVGVMNLMDLVDVIPLRQESRGVSLAQPQLEPAVTFALVATSLPSRCCRV